MFGKIWFVLALGLAGASAGAQDVADPFVNGPNGAKTHTPSGFVCPLHIGVFERDAVGERDPKSSSDFCAYSALDGVYGTVTLVPLHDAFDPKALLTPEFAVQEGTGSKLIGEETQSLGPKSGPLSVYTRTYETTKVAAQRYRILFSSAAVGNWAVEVTLEYADPHDVVIKSDFLNSVYAGAMRQIGVPHPAP
ncbi:MAG: hypothetical protein WCA81_19430 [Rhizomicrobium sp.]